MAVHKMKVKVLDTTSSFVGIKYINSNSKSRMKVDDFIRDYDRGILEVINPDAIVKLIGKKAPKGKKEAE